MRLWWRFVGVQGVRVTDVLAAVAFAFSTGALLIVMSGVIAFQARLDAGSVDADEGIFIVTLSWLAAALLLPAVWTLAQAAVRLAVSRRDARLATLRLAGATRAQVSAIAVADAALQALVGAAAGVGIYFASLPLVSLLQFQGRTFASGELLLPWWMPIAAVAAVLVIAIASALVSLRRVQISPLGVAQRVKPKAISWLRLLAWALLVGVYVVFVGIGIIPIETSVMLVMLAVAVAAILVIGPFLLWVAALIVAKLARTAPTLIAARRLADDPRSAFNVVGAMSIAIMIGGFASLLPAFDADPQVTDLTTGALLTIGIASVLGAVLAGVAQAAKLLDQRDEHRALHLMGAEISVLHRARMSGMAIPLVVMLGGAMGTTLLLLLPMMLLWIGNPTSVLVWLALCAAAAALVMLATAASAPLVRRVATAAA